MFESRRERYANTEMFCCRRDDWHNGRRFMGGALDGPPDGFIGAVGVSVVRSEFVGNEHGVEKSSLHRSGHMLPVFRAREIPIYLILWMSPHAGGVAIDAVLYESEQMRFFGLICCHERVSEG